MKKFFAGPELGRLQGITVFFRDETQDVIVYDEVVQKNEYHLPETFQAGDVIIDIGAHVGYFALACLGRGAGAVICYEPAKDNFELLQANLDYRPVILKQMAVIGSREPTVRFRRGDLCDTAMGRTADVLPGMIYTEVPACRLDDILEAIVAPEVRLLKLDCEGAEYDIIGASQKLSKCREIVGEYHYDRKIQALNHHEVERMVARMKAEGFEVDDFVGHPRCPNLQGFFHAKRR